MATLVSSNSFLGTSSLFPTPAITSTNNKTTTNFPKRPSTATTITSAYTNCRTRTTPSNSSSTTTTLYEVLGIPATASCNEIKKAYRRLARACHPDVVQQNHGNCCGSSNSDQFMKIHDAYLTLSDPGKRASYDRDLFLSRRLSTIDVVGSRLVSGLSGGYSGRNWETDQCW